MSDTNTLLQSPYERLGGETGLRNLVHRFYMIMDTHVQAERIRALHPDTLEGSEDKLFKFLSGWLGGPPLYIQEYGHPMLRARHLHFPIGIRERDEWMLCMERALAEERLDDELVNLLLDALRRTADHMRNQPE